AERLERSRRLASFEEEMELSPTGEEGILLIKALCGLARVISNVNIPNTAGQIDNLPKDAVVETNAVFSMDHIRPVYAGTAPENIRALLLPHVENHARIYRAAVTHDRSLIYESFLNDPLIRGKSCSRSDIEQLVDDMIAGTSDYHAF
ncbi:MAG: alpha-glucosidase/alpha-galactosidase, partial [Lachnospiraceae bacterium]|nr:alpha-glucosidase/alpha-galactosidase [Lachnospiraceae bacterium]